MLLVTLVGMLIPLGFPFEKIDGSAFRVALTTSYLFAAIVLIAMMVYYKVKKFGEVFDIYLSGDAENDECSGYSCIGMVTW